ncbi:MAG TPA: FG-GAP-like repeat-containing protein [Lacunisphaera sp.]|nr:FG-GAP-like repeat-containing protein [Lacunisphaera sp.]
MKTFFALACFALLLSRAEGYALMTTDDSNAYPIKWYGPTITMQIKVDNTTVLSDGNTRATSIQKAMNDPTRGWNQYLGGIQFVPVISAVGSGTDNDEVNQIFFAASPYDYGWDSNTLAITTAWVGDDERVEADIIFNTAFTWDSYRGNLKSNGTDDIQRVALHELGHVLGLDHPDEHGQTVTAVMNSVEGNTDSLQADDIAGAQSLYGAPGVHPANDNFANAITINAATYVQTVNGSSVNATKQSGEPNHANDAGGLSVWWKWTAPANGVVDLDTMGSNFDTLLGVYTGSSVSALTTIASNDDLQDGVIHYSVLSFTATSGTTYYFAVDGWGGDSGAIDLNLDFAIPTAPAITAQPAGASAAIGANAVFTGSANGTPAPTYQWQRNAAGSGTWANLTDSANYSGSSLSSLTVIGVTQAMNGDQFRMVATNSQGSATSNAAALTVTKPADAISYDSTNFPDAAAPGSTIQFTYSVTNQGSQAWGPNHYLVLRDANQNNLQFFSVNGVAPGGSITGSFSLAAPSALGSYVYYIQGLENNVEWFPNVATLNLKVTSGATVSDLNGDGRPDLLWENTTGIDRAIWYMNGASISGFDYLAGIAAEWKITGSADFDGDGHADIAWENTSTGDRTCWYMNGKTIASFGYFALVDPAWHIAAIGDFDGDGKPDLIWENNTTGDRAVWFLDGVAIKSFGYIAGIDPTWHIVGAADFDGDGQTDLVWENQITGDRTIWYMNGATLSSFGYIGNVPGAWHIAMVADMDGDGHPDLVWENRTTGDRAIWLMNNAALLSSPYLAFVDPAWHIAP